MIIDRNIPMVDDALKELDEVGYFMLCRPPSGTFKTFKNLYFGWNPLKPFIWLKNL